MPEELAGRVYKESVREAAMGDAPSLSPHSQHPNPKHPSSKQQQSARPSTTTVSPLSSRLTQTRTSLLLPLKSLALIPSLSTAPRIRRSIPIPPPYPVRLPCPRHIARSGEVVMMAASLPLQRSTSLPLPICVEMPLASRRPQACLARVGAHSKRPTFL